jgi:hypothetical protein
LGDIIKKNSTVDRQNCQALEMNELPGLEVRTAGVKRTLFLGDIIEKNSTVDRQNCQALQ